MITWSENYTMGIEEFDFEHKKIFEIAGRILDRVRSRGDEAFMRLFIIQEGLNYLNSYFERHAKKEEAYMRKIGYEGYALHKMQHDDFTRVQLAKYQKIASSGQCSKKDVLDFVGSGIGWLLEHITTADMAIVGKGVLTDPPVTSISQAMLEEKLNLLFTATLNLESNVKIVSTNYRGEPFGKAVYQKIVYERDGREINVISGIEQSFLMDVAKTLYGDSVENELDLVLSTVEMFGARFWISLSRELIGTGSKINIKENNFLVGSLLSEEIRRLNPTTSILFTSDKGKFFLTCDSDQLFLPDDDPSHVQALNKQ